jgi:hypothetical protein
MLLAVDFDEDLVGVEGITVAPVFSLHSSTVYRTELDAPQANRFSCDSDTPFGKQIFNEWSGTPAMTEIKPIVEPDGVGDDIGWGAPSRNRWRLYVVIHRF